MDNHSTIEEILDFKKTGTGLSTFINIGNTCYLNSALQTLMHIDELKKIFLKTEKKDMYNFLKSLRTVLPCTVCKENYSNHFNLYPPRLNSRKELFEWLVDLHNHVNTEVSKKGDYSNYSYTDVEKMYKSIYKK